MGGCALIKKLSSIDLWKLLARAEVSTPLHSATPLALCLPPHTSFHSFLLISLRIFPLMLFHQRRDYKLHSTWPVGKFKPACSSIYFNTSHNKVPLPPAVVHLFPICSIDSLYFTPFPTSHMPASPINEKENSLRRLYPPLLSPLPGTLTPAPPHHLHWHFLLQ